MPVLRSRGRTAASAPAANRPGESFPVNEGFGIGERPSLPPEPRALSEDLTQGLRLSESDGKDKDTTKVGLLVRNDAVSAPEQKAPEERPEQEQVAGRTAQLAAASSPEVFWRFQQIDRRYRQNLNSPPRVGVLRNFQVQRQGDTVRIVDADGSIYAGGIVQNGAMGAGLAGGATTSFAAANSQQVAQNVITASARDNAALAPFTFRAVGTNRTLNQVVVFTGEYAPVDGTAFSNQLANSFANNTAPPAQTASQVSQARSLETRASRAKALTQPSQQMPSNRLLMPGRIEGRATVGPKDAVTIEAQQVGP